MSDKGNSFSVPMIAALSAAAGCATTYLTMKALSHRRSADDMESKFKIPPNLLADGCKYREEIRVAVVLALEAGENMKPHSESKGTTLGYKSEHNLNISHKSSETDFATAVDVLNEKIISDGLRQHFPSHSIIGEETVGTGDIPPLGTGPTWIVDPIDGTTNFASGQPLTAVSIGLCDGGRPVLGVAYAPITRELYVAISGRGAYRNGARLRSSSGDPKETPKRMSDSIVCCEFGYARSHEAVADMVGAARRVLNHGCRAVRQLGCGVLDLCYVASGRIDVVYTGVAGEGWKPWDYCAAMVIAEEAGCTIRSLNGAPGTKDALAEFDEEGRVVEGSSFDIYSKSMICGVNKTLVEECRNVVLDL